MLTLLCFCERKILKEKNKTVQEKREKENGKIHVKYEKRDKVEKMVQKTDKKEGKKTKKSNPILNVGFLSFDFGDHPMGRLTKGFLRSHDRSKINVSAFSYGLDSKSEMRKKLEKAAQNFVDIVNETDYKAARLD